MIITTVRDLYLALLIELNKQEAPSILIEDFNLFINKTIQNYVNKRLNLYAVGQVVKDDLGPLKILNHPLTTFTEFNTSYPRYFKTELPQNYLHLENCSQRIQMNHVNTSCESQSYDEFPRTIIIEPDPLQRVLKDYYTKPSIKKVYYTPYQLFEEGVVKYYINFYCGQDVNLDIVGASIDYIRKPTLIELKQEDLYSETDTSQKMEFATYVNFEILKELTILVLENSSDPRLNTNGVVNQSIAPPFGTQTK